MKKSDPCKHWSGNAVVELMNGMSGRVLGGRMHRLRFRDGVMVCLLMLCALGVAEDARKEFADPPIRYAPRPLWFWNNTPVSAEGIQEQMREARDQSGYGGFGILPFGKEFRPEYLSEDYFRMYGVALEEAKKLGMTMCLYDEYGFPSGSGGAGHGDGKPRFAKAHPAHTIKRLDKHEEDVSGPADYSADIPEGCLMAVVAMEEGTKRRIDLAGKVRDGRLHWAVPAGRWKVMRFVCVRDGDPIVDYLDPQAVERYIAMTHEEYFRRFKEYFGTTIDGTFFDEPTLYRAKGRMWTEAFNGKFRLKHGFDPAPYYPALWYDIGPETQAARNHLFGFRAELYATGYPKVTQDWCAAHGITATGHQDQEEVVNPVSVSGDLMLCMKHQAVPGVDKIGGNRPAERFYKVVSSVAYNWDKSLVMSETYGAMGDIPWEEIYQVAMEQYTKGINQLIPHGVWYDDGKVTFKPELSWRNGTYAGGLRKFTTYLSRLNLLLQNDGRHVADIGVLYPIATLQGGHSLDGPLGHYKGGVVMPEADYVDVGELLATRVGRDFTFVHPEVLDERCRVRGSALDLENRLHFQKWQVMVVPGHQTIRWSNVRRIREFYEMGGKVIATGTLPHKSAEFGHDVDVVKAMADMFSREVGVDGAPVVRSNGKGGMAVFLKTPTAERLRDMLDRMVEVPDVRFEPGHELRYIHKVHEGRHVYLFANLGKQVIDTEIHLRGALTPEWWNPHDGRISKAIHWQERRGGVEVTQVRVKLEAGASIFAVAEETGR